MVNAKDLMMPRQEIGLKSTNLLDWNPDSDESVSPEVPEESLREPRRLELRESDGWLSLRRDKDCRGAECRRAAASCPAPLYCAGG